MIPTNYCSLLWISIQQRKKDSAYTPVHSSRQWSTSMRDKWLTREKKIYKEESLVASYNRVYTKTYHKIIADLMRTPGLWFLRLKFNFINGGSSFLVTSETKERGNEHYTIWERNTKVAEIYTDLRAKNIATLRELTRLTIGEHAYEFRARSIRSTIEVVKDGDLIGEVYRGPYGERFLRVEPGQVNEETEPLLIIGWIVFTYRFDK